MYEMWCLQAEYDKLRVQHEASIKDSENDLSAKLHELRDELDGKWKNILRWIGYKHLHLMFCFNFLFERLIMMHFHILRPVYLVVDI